MRFEAKKIKLRDGRTAIFRPPAIEDAAALLDYLKVTASETPFLLRTPEECCMSLGQEEEYIRNKLSDEYSATIVCEVEGELAGNCDLSGKRHVKLRHRGLIGIALKEKYWGLGIGSAMFDMMEDIGRSLGLEQLELEVFDGNYRAIALYEKKGFRSVRAIPNAVKLPDGRRFAEIYMVKELC